jgi:DNA-binding XRE family transcriptional regulator
MRNQLRDLRGAHGWSQAHLADLLEVSRQTVIAIENGKYDPSLPLAFAIARLFGLTIESIFFPEEQRMKRHCIAALLACATAFGAAVPAAAADTPAPASRYAATIAPAERFEIDGVLVERHGSRGRPLILIPGLASGSWVWQARSAPFRDHALYVLTLPGFDGRPAAGANPSRPPAPRSPS